jgi:tRNA(Ile2) C34 agmatinyltransferase TiaS
VSTTAITTHSPELAIDATTERSAMRLFEPKGLTLEDVVLGAWEDLVAGGPAECPVCGGSMRSAGGCDSCGSDLS